MRTIRGQEIELYPATAAMSVEKRERGRTYRLCQILPASPQRLEWIRVDNIAELPKSEIERLRRTPRPDAIKRSRVESPPQDQDQDQDQSRKAA